MAGTFGEGAKPMCLCANVLFRFGWVAVLCDQAPLDPSKKVGELAACLLDFIFGAMDKTKTYKTRCLQCGHTFALEELETPKHAMFDNQSSVSLWCPKCGAENLLLSRPNRFAIKG